MDRRKMARDAPRPMDRRKMAWGGRIDMRSHRDAHEANGAHNELPEPTMPEAGGCWGRCWGRHANPREPPVPICYEAGNRTVLAQRRPVLILNWKRHGRCYSTSTCRAAGRCWCGHVSWVWCVVPMVVPLCVDSWIRIVCKHGPAHATPLRHS